VNQTDLAAHVYMRNAMHQPSEFKQAKPKPVKVDRARKNEMMLQAEVEELKR